MNRDTDLELEEMFHGLYPTLSEGELEEARANLERYIQLALGVFERTCVEPSAHIVDVPDQGSLG